MPFGLESILPQIIQQTQGGAQNLSSIPRPPQLPVQLPQLTQLPPFLPSPVPGGPMPFLRDRMMSSVLSPLMQPNFSLPIIDAAGQRPISDRLSPTPKGGAKGGGIPLVLAERMFRIPGTSGPGTMT